MGAAVYQAPGQCQCSTPTYPCSPCPIPKRNLTLSWTNNLIGPGSTTLTYNGSNGWSSGCVNQLLFQLLCVGLTEFVVTYFLSGACPSGQSQSCTYPGYSPFGITLSHSSCSPFELDFTITSGGCPVLWSDGYTSFKIT